MRRTLLLALILAAIPSAAHAGVRVGIGLNFGLPVYGYGPYCYQPYYAPVYVAPPPVVYAPAPVYVAPAPVAAPAVAPAVAVPAPPSVVRAARPTVESGDLASLNDPVARTRADGCIGLGRARDVRAVSALSRCLREDNSPEVRDAAARALGLIGSPAGLDALQRAAGGDADRDVRRSASFAAEVIRANMER